MTKKIFNERSYDQRSRGPSRNMVIQNIEKDLSTIHLAQEKINGKSPVTKSTGALGRKYPKPTERHKKKERSMLSGVSFLLSEDCEFTLSSKTKRNDGVGD